MQKLSRWSGENGSALVFALVFGIVLSIMGIVGVQLIGGGSSMSRRDIEIIKSFWANEGALQVGFRYITCVTTLPTASIAPFTVTPNLVLNGDTPNVSISVVANRSCCYSCSTTTGMSAVSLRNTTVCDSFTVNNLSRYTDFQSTTNTAIWEAMVVHGDYHTNGYIYASSAMTNVVHVTGLATTSGRISPSHTVDRPNYPSPYQDGFDINGVTSETASWFQSRMPNYATVGTIQTNVISSNSSDFTNATTVSTSTSIDSVGIQLNGSNVTVWNHSTSTKKWTSTTLAIANITGGVLKTQKPTYVWGTLDGKLTVVSDSATGSVPNDIIIGGNITYADTNLSTSTDVLALVSSNNVVIPSVTNNATTGMVNNFTTKGVTVYGSFFMSNGQINVLNISSYSSLQNFNVHGGVLLLNQTLGTYSTSPTSHGIVGQYYQDPRFVGNAAVAPGIPNVNAVDPERSTGTTAYMYLLGNGTWDNWVGTL